MTASRARARARPAERGVQGRTNTYIENTYIENTYIENTYIENTYIENTYDETYDEGATGMTG
ncbi:hypothetical protein ABZ858_28265 [Streptomyces sp. NPDC047017]|uniref:hypothetical protein n=1 Tax=Streptomyces sp. NPDC047017 TaxID=3155024 RepID=UPI003404A6EA